MNKRTQYIITFLFLVAVVLFLGIELFEDVQTLPLEVENATRIAIFILLIALLVLHLAHIRRTASIEEAYRQVDVLKQEFIAIAGTEMKAPIANMHAYLGLLKTTESGLSEEQETIVRKMEIESKNLGDLVSDLIASTELERNIATFTYTDFNLEEVVTEVVNMFSPIAKEKGLLIKKEELKEIVIHSDRKKVERALMNLVSNAIKYTKKGTVTVSYTVKDDMACLRVSDSGIGISKEELQNIFQKFYRIKSKETESIPGTGLGLWLTRAIMRKLGGDIAVTSSEGVGTTFTLSLPITKEPDRDGESS